METPGEDRVTGGARNKSSPIHNVSYAARPASECSDSSPPSDATLQIINGLKMQNQRMRENLAGLQRDGSEARAEVAGLRQSEGALREHTERLERDKSSMTNEITELRKRINGYQSLSQLYHEKKREATYYRCEVDRLQGVAGIAPVPAGLSQAQEAAMVFGLVDGTMTDPASLTQSDAAQMQGVHAMQAANVTGSENDALQGGSGVPARAPIALMSPVDNAIWSMSAASLDPAASMDTDTETCSVGADDAAIQRVSGLLCGIAGMSKVSPLAIPLIQLALSVLQTEQQVYITKEAEDGAMSPSTSQTSQQAMLDNAVRQLKEQEKALFSLQQQVKKLETEKRTIEMHQRLWVIEKECLHEQIRSLKDDLARVQIENVTLRGERETLHTETSISLNSDALANMSPRELRTEVAVLQHQVTVYKEDFDRERQDREKTLAEKNGLLTQLNQIKVDQEQKTERLSIRERELAELQHKFSALSNEYCTRAQELARLRPLVNVHRTMSQTQHVHSAAQPSTPSWVCARCTFLNQDNSTNCQMCTTRRDFAVIGMEHNFRPELRMQHGQHGQHGHHHGSYAGYSVRGGRIECDVRTSGSESGMEQQDHCQLPSVLPDSSTDTVH